MNAKSNTKIFYPKSFKRQILTANSTKKNLLPIFEKFGYNIHALLKKDSRYISKLIYKWKQELCANKLNFAPSDFDNETIQAEIAKFNNFMNKKFYKNYYDEHELLI